MESRRVGQHPNIPEEIHKISDWWTQAANARGDVGSCVCGAEFRFVYGRLRYVMPPLSKWQGSCSWEADKNTVALMLELAGASEIEYHWGNMD